MMALHHNAHILTFCLELFDVRNCFIASCVSLLIVLRVFESIFHFVTGQFGVFFLSLWNRQNLLLK